MVSYFENKEMIYESVNLKGAEYEPKQNSSSLQSITICTCFGNIGPIFYKVHSLIDNNRDFAKHVTDWYCKLCKGLNFLEKLDFRLLHKNGS